MWRMPRYQWCRLGSLQGTYMQYVGAEGIPPHA